LLIVCLAAGNLAAGSVAAAPQAAASQPSAAVKLSDWVVAHTAAGQTAEFLVVLGQQADLSGAAALPTKAAKGRGIGTYSMKLFGERYLGGLVAFE
jgi:hypothetical protein